MIIIVSIGSINYCMVANERVKFSVVAFLDGLLFSCLVFTPVLFANLATNVVDFPCLFSHSIHVPLGPGIPMMNGSNLIIRNSTNLGLFFLCFADFFL